MANILVTGGAGYIGSHTCKELASQGHTPVTLDNLSRGHQECVKWGPFVHGSIHDTPLVVNTLRSYKIKAVIHFAAYAYVSESVDHPQMYFDNNVKGSLLLFEAMRQAQVKNIVFSSSCATYGESQSHRISEDHPQKPINPYGLTKLMVENTLLEQQTLNHLNFISLRYFNAAGTDPEGELLEHHEPEPHILPNIIRAALTNTPVTLYGSDYPTPDGTCVRDFIHVSDLARAHNIALTALLTNKPTHPFYNLSNTRGFSLLELTNAVESYLQKDIQVNFAPRRHGDPARLVGSSDRFRNRFSWNPQHSDIKTLIETTVRGQKKLIDQIST